MASPAFFAAGGRAQGGADLITIAVPAGSLIGKICLAIIVAESYGGTAASTGWTSICANSGQVNSHLDILWKRFASSDVAATYDFDVLGSSASLGVMLAFSGCLQSGDVIGSTSAGSKVAANATVTTTTTTPPVDGCGVIYACVAQDATTVRTCSAYSGTSPTFTEVHDSGEEVPGLGTFVSIAVALGVQTTAAATGTRTATLSGVPIENQGIMFSLKPEILGGGGYGGGYRRMEPFEPLPI